MAFQVDNPLWFLGFIPMVVVLYLYWRSNSLLSGGRKIVLTVLRTIVFTLIILALAGVQILWPIQQMATAFVVDRSHSMADNEEFALKQVNDAINGKAPEDQAGIVSTGREAVVETPLSDQGDGIQSFQTEVNRSYTNLASGLQLAGSLFSADDKGRVVLMTDGNENIGDALRQASYLNKRGYIVDVMPFESVYKDDVAISSFDVPENIYLGEQATLSMTIDSSIDTTSQIRITQDGETIIDQTVELNKGTNQLAFNHLVSTDGFHTFNAEIVSEGDQVIENNQLSAFAETKGLPNVLIVEGKNDAAANLEKALDASAVQVETIPPALLPGQLSSYLTYDSIIFSNVSAHMTTGKQMELIERAVKDFGVGFIMTGGDQSFGVGGYFKTPIERLMPVNMDLKGKKELPSLGLSIVLDKSGSMMGSKIALAREAAARSVGLLREKDTLGVIAFDSAPWQVVELGPINDKEEVLKNIRSITASGGTDIFTPLSQAYAQMEPLELKRKHIILLTDGQSATSINYRQMIEEAQQKGITLSTVAIGMGADGPLLEEMAQLGGGRFYQVQNDSSIPTILSRETALVTRTYIEDDPFFPKLVRAYGWGSYFENGVPQMNAYIATTPKGRAQQILTSEKGDPVLTRWQYGLGKTVAWTSDLSGKWAGNWPAWKNWSPLWNDIVTWTFPQYQKQTYQVSKKIEGNQVTLNVTAADNDPANLTANLVSETGEEVDFNLQPKAPGEYQGTFEASESGVYFLQISERQNEKVVGSFKTGIVVPYSKEYTFTPTNDHLIEEIASAGGGQVIENLDNVFSPEDLPPRYDRQDLFYLLLAVALLLFMVDVAVRRFRINFAFVTKLSSGLKKQRSKVSEVTEKRSAQLGQLKQASTKKTAPQPKQTNLPVKQKPDPPKKGKQKEKMERQKPVEKSKPSQSNGGESKEERLARLLSAKKRGGK
ncbi:VWA domain-containing protein [Virgibacillus doumboii]|uniref:VWA domain-containing protein n=1 Tax=Virgibacillus doumboii TaxID=2697503 RepID=UPI0013DFE753|nr:VWA domain-containing protein [Virgibacillus doumboii]